MRKVSSFHETEPVGGPPGQGMFLNAVAVVETGLEPLPLLGVLQGIESRFGRERKVRWGERTLDLDLLLFEERIIDTPGLCVPHPRMRSAAICARAAGRGRRRGDRSGDASAVRRDPG